MNQDGILRVGIILGIGVLAAAMLAGLLMILQEPEPSAPAPTLSPPPSSPTHASATATPLTESANDNPVVVSVNDHAIRYDFYRETLLLDQVVSGLAGQSIPTNDQTLQRLINEELVLQAAAPEERPTPEEIEERINALEKSWGVEDTEVASALEEVDLDWTAFEGAIERLLRVERALSALQNEGHGDISTWLNEQRASADIQIEEDVSELSLADSERSAQTEATSPKPPTETPAPTPPLPDVATDFTLKQAGGGAFTLTEQLAEGPVVLVFFQRCG